MIISYIIIRIIIIISSSSSNIMSIISILTNVLIISRFG